MDKVLNNNTDNDNNKFELDGEKYILVKEVEEEVIDENGNKKLIIRQYMKLNLYEKNKESYKKSNKKYVENHRKEKNEYNKKIYKERYENDPEFREREKTRSREKYIKKKQLKNDSII